MDAGLVMRKNKKYRLTSLGKIVYGLQITTQNTLNNYWKLRAIDSFEGVSEREQEQVIENLIGDEAVDSSLLNLTISHQNSFSHSTLINWCSFVNYCTDSGCRILRHTPIRKGRVCLRNRCTSRYYLVLSVFLYLISSCLSLVYHQTISRTIQERRGKHLLSPCLMNDLISCTIPSHQP
jgi:hypothetical protein